MSDPLNTETFERATDAVLAVSHWLDAARAAGHGVATLRAVIDARVDDAVIATLAHREYFLTSLDPFPAEFADEIDQWVRMKPAPGELRVIAFDSSECRLHRLSDMVKGARIAVREGSN